MLRVRWGVSLAVLVVALMFAGCGASSIKVSLSGGTAMAIDQGQSVTINATLTNDSTSQGVTWSCSGAACTNLTTTTTSATFNASGPTGTATITATSVKQASASSSVTVTVTAPPSTTTTQAQLTAKPATVGQAYSLTVTASGGAGTLTWSATGLSDGLTINSSTGTISGTPTQPGPVTFTYTVKDSSTAGAVSTTSGSLTITVNNPPPPTITTTQSQVSAATAGTAYSFTFQASGTGTLTWSATGLSDGLSFNTTNGTVSGTPTAKATVVLMVTVSDSFGQSSSATAFTITVNNPAPPAITTTQAQVSNGTTGIAYSFQFHGTGGGTLTWSATGLPADGLSLNSGTGVVSGTPTAVQPVPFTLTLSDSFGQSSSPTAFTITVNPPAPALSITKTHTGNFTQGQQNATYTVTVTNTGTAATDGTTVTVADTIPAGETLVSMTGTNWACASNSCTRSDVLQPNGSYDVITVTVNVASNAASPQTNQVSVSGGGSPSNNASDPTTINLSCGSGSESLLNGNYAFVLTGFDNGQGAGETAPEPALVGGVITVNGGGSITAGTLDMNLNSTAGVLSKSISAGSYSIGSDHRGCMAITTTAGTQNYRFSLNSTGSIGHMIDFDSTGPFTAGELRKQSNTIPTTLSGNFAFGVSAPQNTASCDNTICGGKFGAVGVFDFSTGGSVTGGQVDFSHGDGTNAQVDGANLNPSNFPASSVSITGGSYSIQSNGRGTMTFTPGGGTADTVIYVISSSDALVLGSDDQTANSAFAGEILQQSGSFSTSTLSGNYIGATSKLDGTPGNSDVNLIDASFSSGNLNSATIYANHGGNVSVQTGGTGTFTLSATGRMLLSITGNNHNPVLYLVNANEAFELGSDSGVEFGPFQAQTSTSAPNATYALGTTNPETSSVSDNEGVATLSSGNVSVTEDDNSSGGQKTGQINSFTFSVDGTGFGMVPSGCTPSTAGSCQFVFYVISSTSAVGTDFTGSGPNVQPLDQ